MSLFLLLLVFIGIAIGLAWFLVTQDRGEKEPVGALWIAVGFGLIGGVLASVTETKYIPADWLDPGGPLGPTLVAALMVGIVEETCKFLPLSLFLARKRYFNEHTDGVIYFALAGLGFGLPENVLYTLEFGTKTGVARVILTPFFHAAITAMVGYYFAKRKLSKKSLFGVIPALLLAMLLHGLYDFGLISGVPLFAVVSLCITLTLSGGLFYLYSKATGMDQALGLSAVGHNAFCRSCGYPNPKRYLYCTNCGKNA